MRDIKSTIGTNNKKVLCSTNVENNINITAEASFKIFEKMIFGLSFTLHFFIKQPIQTVLIYNQYIHIDCCSILLTNDKIIVMICKPEDNEKTTEEGKRMDQNTHDEGTDFLSTMVADFSKRSNLFFIHKSHTKRLGLRQHIFLLR